MSQPSVYLNHAGTSWPKPPPVRSVIAKFLEGDASDWSKSFEESHRQVADFLGVSQISHLLPTPGGTSAIATAISDFPLQAGDSVLTSRWEHHAMMRPLLHLQKKGVELGFMEPGQRDLIDLDRLESQLSRLSRVRLIAMTTACNVTGEILPFESVISIAQSHGVPVMLDASQTVGWLPTHLEELGAMAIAFAGHKGLLAPWGIGFLYLSPQLEMTAPEATCQIGNGVSSCQGQPSYCDVGSTDRLALIGAAAAVEWLGDTQQANRLEQANKWKDQLAACFEQQSDIEIVVHSKAGPSLPTVAIHSTRRELNELAALFSEAGLQVSAGLQCSPSAHQSLETAPGGVVRFSLGATTTANDVERTLQILDEILR